MEGSPVASLQETVFEGGTYRVSLPGHGGAGSGGPLKVVVSIVPNVIEILNIRVYLHETSHSFLMPF